MENTNKVNGFNFNQDISRKAIGEDKLFLYASEDIPKTLSDGLFIKTRNNNQSMIFINKDINNFDEFITILFHELGHYVLHSNNEDIEQSKAEEQANKFAEYMRHIFYNSIELAKILKQ